MTKPFKTSLADCDGKLRVQCQHCGKLNKTKHLDFDVLCEHCHNWAKRSFQKVRAKKIVDKTNKMILIVYSVIKSEREVITA